MSCQGDVLALVLCPSAHTQGRLKFFLSKTGKGVCCGEYGRDACDSGELSVIHSNFGVFLQLWCFSSTLVFFSNFGVFLQLRLFSPTSVFFSNFGVFLQLRCFSPTSVFFFNFGFFLQLWLFCLFLRGIKRAPPRIGSI